MVMEILFGAIAEAIMSVLIEDLVQRTKIVNLRARLSGGSPEKLAIQRALERAYKAFNQKYPELSNSFFDGHYLQQSQVIAELAKILTPNKSPDKIALTEYWEAQFGSKPNCGLQEPLACFLDEFEKEVKSEPALKHLIDSRAFEQLYTISAENKEQTAIQKEIRDLLYENLDSRSKVTIEHSGSSDYLAERVTSGLPSYQSSDKAIANIQNLRYEVEVLEESITLEDKLTLLGAVYQTWVGTGKSVFELKHEISKEWGFDSWKRANVAKYLVGRGFLLDETPDSVSYTVYTQVRLTQEGADWCRKHSTEKSPTKISPLKKLLDELPAIKELHFYHPDFQSWHNAVKQFLYQIFGENSYQVTEYDRIAWHTSDSPEDQGEQHELYLRSCIAAEGVLRGIVRATPLFETNSLHQQTRLDASSMNLYFHKNPPYNAVKMLYTGTEIAKDLDVRVIYQDSNNIEQIKVIEEFFPEEDSKMIWHHYKYDFLKMDQVVYFRLPRRKSVLDGRVIVLVSFVGANSGIPVKVEKIFELQQ